MLLIMLPSVCFVVCVWHSVSVLLSFDLFDLLKRWLVLDFRVVWLCAAIVDTGGVGFSYGAAVVCVVVCFV